MLLSFAQDGIRPQRMVVNLRVFLPSSLRTVTTCWVGAMLYRGRSSISPTAPKRSAKYGFAYVNRYLLHTCLLSQIERPEVLEPDLQSTHNDFHDFIYTSITQIERYCGYGFSNLYDVLAN